MARIQGAASYKEKQHHLLIGLMSGTSLDGVDAALVSIETDKHETIQKVRLEQFYYLPYSDALRQQVMLLCSPETARVDQLTVTHYGLAEWYAYAVQQLLRQAGVAADQVDAICMHGQTVWHVAGNTQFPGPEGETSVRASLQIGELSTVMERTGIPVVGNFRARDLAAGGEGAPLVPYADLILFRDEQKGRLLQNIGGIANVTVIPAAAADEHIFAFDTGPGNMVIDELVKEGTAGRLRFDEGGKIAASGRVSTELLEIYLADAYYQLQPPKSTGREVYGKAFVDRFRAEGHKKGLSFEDMVATATALTAKTIAQAFERFVFPLVPIDQLIVSGGGAHNETMLGMLKAELPKHIVVMTSAQFGIPDDAKEAIAFAILGHETLMGRPSNVPSVTGASRPVILGNICW
ncbi:anhydro-N-acetylmuramic acid kinase [Brevibacillus fulvus]|uniref:Anhydro-N-acetylmuramic acid kinase n=1 Tax=Brevibacillus fulvus TaxID=1125967 RepID=A0A938Y3G5_9BACL|nr:anhydro-N-acetylmuramic acid kinase [Brevibacillus fulvus]MBM7591659.1 anhydro-N-acetylmuramic acid kinase [Brevibacillus fulvus]